MSLDDIKRQIAKLTAQDWNELRSYLDMLQSNQKAMDPLSDEIWEEIDRRTVAYTSGKMKAYPAREVLDQINSQLTS